jgi:hypothetical protein
MASNNITIEVTVPAGFAGLQRIVNERVRQIEKELLTPEHDDEHIMGEMAAAALCYAYKAIAHDVTSVKGGFVSEWWPWEPRWYRPSGDPIRNLEKAGALIAAEIDRLLRARVK